MREIYGKDCNITQILWLTLVYASDTSLYVNGYQYIANRIDE